MLGFSKKTWIQLVKEFCIPFLVATGWTVYVAFGQDVTFQNIIGNFGPSFFLASWATGQFFRVRKQAGVEQSLGNVEKRLNHLVDDLESKSQHMINYLTGGDSYLYFLPLHAEGGKIVWLARHIGEYPLHQVSVRIVDIEYLLRTFKPDGARNFAQTRNLGEVHQDTNVSVGENEIGDRAEYSFNIFTHARNGKFVQEVRFKKIDGVVLTALRITGPSGVFLEEIDPKFPVDADGKVVWDKPAESVGVHLKTFTADEIIPIS